MTGAERPTTVVRLEAGAVEYRLEKRGNATVVVFHGGHMRAGLAFGEEVFAEAGYTLLVPSRPGYGRTPLSTGTTVSGFADVTRALCEHLGISEVAAVVGISGGGPTAVTMAARHPDLVARLILQSAVGWHRTQSHHQYASGLWSPLECAAAAWVDCSCGRHGPWHRFTR